MEAPLLAVRRTLFVLLFASLLVAVVARPAPENRRLVAALGELESFRASFVQQAAEQALEQQAAAEGERFPQIVEGAARAHPGPRIDWSPAASRVRPLTAVSLATLSEIEARAQTESDVKIAMADVNALDWSLAWRFARTEKKGPFTLKAIELLRAEVSAADVALEQEVARLRVDSLNARAALESATRRITPLEQRVEFQSKRRSKSLFKSRLALEEARAALIEKTQTRADLQLRYDEAAQRAGSPRKLRSARDVPSHALARVSYEVGGESSVVDVPVPLVLHTVKVAPLGVTSFPVVRAAGLWDELQAQNADGAIARVEAKFNWHLRRVPVLGVELSGWWLLALLPWLLPPLCWLLLRQLHRAETSYSPFLTKLPTALPPVGLNHRVLELVVLILLPLVAVASAAAALVLNGKLPILPGLSGIACLVLGINAFSKLQDLREQTQSIVSSNSYPPAAPRT